MMNTHSITRFFETKGAPYLLESIYVKSYSDLGCCSIKSQDTINIFFSNFEKVTTSDVFFHMIRDGNKYQVFLSSFQELLNDADERCLIYAKEGNGSKLIELFLNFLSFYRFTESFYTDYTYQNFSSVSDIKEHLKSLEQLKTKGRNFLNSFFNGNSSYISIVSNTTQNPLVFLYSSVDEVLNNIQPSDAQITDRIGDHLLTYADTLFPSNTNEYRNIEDYFIQNGSNEIEVIKGIVASKGSVRAPAYILNANFTNYNYLDKIISEMPTNVILITETTSPDLIQACQKAVGIVTNQGGLGSHAAIISRELGIPCIVATHNATKVIYTGDIVEIDGGIGEVRIIERR